VARDVRGVGLDGLDAEQEALARVARDLAAERCAEQESAAANDTSGTVATAYDVPSAMI